MEVLMTQFIGPAPIWTDVTSEEYQLWFSKVGSAINENAATGVAGGGTDLSGLTLDNDTGEITQDDTLYGYFRRYLHIRFATDEDGTTLLGDITNFNGDTLYIGTFNTDNITLPTNANFTFRAFNFGASQIASYILEGGRRIEFRTGDLLSDGFTRVTTPITLDLDAVAQQGEAGLDGFNNATVQIFQRANVEPATRPDEAGSYNFNTGDFLFGSDQPTPAFAEQGTITVSANAATNTGVVGTPESFVLDIEGNTGMMAAGSIPGSRIAITIGTPGNGTPFNGNDSFGVTDMFVNFGGTNNVRTSSWTMPNPTGTWISNMQTLIAASTTNTDNLFPNNSMAGQLIIQAATIAVDGTVILTIARATGYTGMTFADTTDAAVGFGGAASLQYNTGTTGAANTGDDALLPSSIRIQVPASTIDETIAFAPMLTTKATIAADFVTKFNANDDLRVLFNTASVNDDDDVIFSTLLNGNIDAIISETDNSGDITLVATATDGGAGSIVPPVIQINTPSDTETEEVIMLSTNLVANDIANLIGVALGNNGYTITIVGNVINYTRNLTGVADNITIQVTTQGSSNLLNSTFGIVVTRQGAAATPGVTTTLSNGWYTRVDLVPTGDDPIWVRQAVAISRDNTDPIDPSEWSGVFQAGSTGVDGQDGLNQATVFLYQRTGDGVAPTQPTLASTYTFGTLALVPSLNNGWSTVIPAASEGGFIWVVAASVSSNAATAMIPPLQWSMATILSQRGDTGAPGSAGTNGASVLVVYADNELGQNQSLTIGDRQFVQYFEYTGLPPALPIGGAFIRFIGTDGTNGQSIFPIYATNANGDGQSFDDANRSFVTFLEAAVQPTLPVAGHTFVRFIGTDGANGQPGTNGQNVLVIYG